MKSMCMMAQHHAMQHAVLLVVWYMRPALHFWANPTAGMLCICAGRDCSPNGFKMYQKHGPSHTCEGLEACTYGPNGVHGLENGQLKPHNCGEQNRQNPVPERGESSWITFTLYGHVVWWTAFPLHVVTCTQYVPQGLSRVALCSTMSFWGNQMLVAACTLPQQTAVWSARFNIELPSTHHPLQS